MTEVELKALVDALAPVVRDYVAKAVTAATGELGTLRARVAALEARPAPPAAHEGDRLTLALEPTLDTDGTGRVN